MCSGPKYLLITTVERTTEIGGFWLKVDDCQGVTTFLPLNSKDDWAKVYNLPPNHMGILIELEHSTKFPVANHTHVSVDELFGTRVEKGKRVAEVIVSCSLGNGPAKQRLCKRCKAEKSGSLAWTQMLYTRKCTCKRKVYLFKGDLCFFNADSYDATEKIDCISQLDRVERYYIKGKFKCEYVRTMELSDSKVPIFK